MHGPKTHTETELFSNTPSAFILNLANILNGADRPPVLEFFSLFDFLQLPFTFPGRVNAIFHFATGRAPPPPRPDLTAPTDADPIFIIPFPTFGQIFQ